MDHLFNQRKILIICGTGGVGKTTLSAALAIRAAQRGSHALVMTIDPAKRLANALGFQNWSTESFDLTPNLAAIESQKQHPFLGQLTAFIPNTQKTFEHLIELLGFSSEAAHRIIQNKIFQIFAKEFSGANEYMALERLLHFHEQKDYDCIILDTPPSENTLTFLHAPELLAEFFDHNISRWLNWPKQPWISSGIKKAFQLLENLTSAHFITDLLEFTTNLLSKERSFSRRLEQITSLLQSSQVGFCMVTNPTPETCDSVRTFTQILNSKKFRFDGILLNRTLNHLPLLPQSSNSQALTLLQALQARQTWACNYYQEHQLPVCKLIPELNQDVHSLSDLIQITDYLHAG